MSELGYVDQPEQYARAGDDCILADSITARNFFKQRTDADGLIFIGGLYYAAIRNSFLPVWFMVNAQTTKIISATPIFRIKNFDFYDGLAVTKTNVISDDTYFYWNDMLYGVVFTSTGEMIVRRIRCILSAGDMFKIANLSDEVKPERCYPVKLYDQNDGRFLAVAWELESEDCYWYETVCSEDDARLSKIKACDLVSYPISIGDVVIIGDDYFTCYYDKVFDLYFRKTAFKATEADREKENIPLKNASQPKRPQLKVIFSKSDDEKKEEEKTISRFVALKPKNGKKT